MGLLVGDASDGTFEGCTGSLEALELRVNLVGFSTVSMAPLRKCFFWL